MKNSKQKRESYFDYELSLRRERVIVQARLCENANHYAMAAILWHRLGKGYQKQAVKCEDKMVLYAETISPELEPKAPEMIKDGFSLL